MKPFKCCFNCDCAMEPAGNGSDEFNKTKRMCGAVWYIPSYNSYEKRSCKGFTPRNKLKMHGKDYYIPDALKAQSTAPTKNTDRADTPHADPLEAGTRRGER